MSDYVRQNAISTHFSVRDSWIILGQTEVGIHRKIAKFGIPLKDWNLRVNRGVLTGLNDAFIIDHAQREKLILRDPRSAELIRPILRGRDVKRAVVQHDGRYLIAIFPSLAIDIDEYPAVRDHLLTFGKTRLEQSGAKDIDGHKTNARKKTANKWFELQDTVAYWQDFGLPKLIYAETMRIHKSADSDRFPRFAYDNAGFSVDKSCFIATGDHIKFVMGILNSEMGRYQIRREFAVLDSGGFLMQKIYVEQLRIPRPNKQLLELVEKLVGTIISKRTMDECTNAEEDLVDELAFELYKLSPEEIKFVKASH